MIHDRHRQWIEARGLDPALAEKLGFETTTRDGAAWLSIPYREGETTINHKYRLTSEKRHMMDSGAPLGLWNADCLTAPEVVNGQAPVVITEGEWDAMAAIQSGFRFAVSVPNGAPAQRTADLETATRYDWIDRHAAALKGVREFVIAADADQPGFNLAADLVALLGADRCRFIEYPFPCKDLNEVLKEYGPERVVHTISTARPYPVKGLFSLADFPEKGEVQAYSIGVPCIAEMIHVVPGTLTVLTGFANMGKSTLMDLIVANALLRHFPVCVASFETDVKPILRDGLRCAMLGIGHHELASADLRQVDAVLAERLSIISQAVDEDMEMDLDYFLECCRVAVKRGARMIVLDPWNELEHKNRRDENETAYIGRALRAIKRFAKQYDVAFWIVAHPSKPQQGFKGAPGLYEISGSANWANKADYGLTYHRKAFDSNEAQIIVSKVRKGLPGRRGSVKVSFDFRTSTFAELPA